MDYIYRHAKAIFVVSRIELLWLKQTSQLIIANLHSRSGQITLYTASNADFLRILRAISILKKQSDICDSSMLHSIVAQGNCTICSTYNTKASIII